jgi:hypothetical protein
MNGSIRLHWSAWTPAPGDSIQLFQNVKTFAGTPVLENDVIDAEKGLYWDTTDLATKGLLRVKSINGLNQTKTQLVNAYVMDRKIVVPGVNNLRIYTIYGLRVDPASCLIPGTYIVVADGQTIKISVE